MGDFNNTISIDERRNCGKDLIRRCSNFPHWIRKNEFIDPGFSGQNLLAIEDITQKLKNMPDLIGPYATDNRLVSFPRPASITYCTINPSMLTR